MKKVSLFALIGLLGFGLTACGGSTGAKIEFNKTYMTGSNDDVMSATASVDVKFKDDKTVFFDLSLNPDPNIPGFDVQNNFDKTGTFEYDSKTKNYTFILTKQAGQDLPEPEKWVATYDEKTKEHSIADYYMLVENKHIKEIPLKGALPLL